MNQATSFAGQTNINPKNENKFWTPNRIAGTVILGSSFIVFFMLILLVTGVFDDKTPKIPYSHENKDIMATPSGLPSADSWY